MNLRKVTLAVLVRALIAVIFSPVKFLLEWIYTDDEPKARVLAGGGFAYRDLDTAEEWAAVYDLFEKLDCEATARETVQTAIERRMTPTCLLAKAMLWHMQGAHGTKRQPTPAPTPDDPPQATETAILALVKLGYSKNAAKKAVNRAVANTDGTLDAEQTITAALRLI